MKRLSLDDPQGIREQYQREGFVILESILSPERTDAFLESVERLKRPPFNWYRSQDTNRPEFADLSPQGFLIHSVMNPMELPLHPIFRRRAEDIVCNSHVSQALGILTGKSSHWVFQSMFFDRSTGTLPHQDTYYLDTEPAGGMVAAWYSLEDIHEKAGPFFVVPGSHLGPVVPGGKGTDRFADHAGYVRKMQALIQERGYTPVPTLLKKGEVLLWHPFLVHGALPNRDPAYSRKSLTAHFMPEGVAIQDYGYKISYPVRPSRACPEIQVLHRGTKQRWAAAKAYLGFPKEIRSRPQSEASAMDMRPPEQTQGDARSAGGN